MSSDHNHVTRRDTEGCPACDKREGRVSRSAERRLEAPPAMPDLSAFPSVQHRIEGGRFICPGDENARCHRYPGCDHEHWPCEHEYVGHAECWVVPWITASDLCDSYAGTEHELLLRDEDFPDGDVTWTWEGDWVSFDYGTDAQVTR
ncbi:hypothetical protein [Microbacterium sp. KNMS]